MKSEKLLRAIGDLPDNMILEAIPQNRVSGRKRASLGTDCIKE